MGTGRLTGKRHTAVIGTGNPVKRILSCIGETFEEASRTSTANLQCYEANSNFEEHPVAEIKVPKIWTSL